MTDVFYPDLSGNGKGVVDLDDAESGGSGGSGGGSTINISGMATYQLKTDLAAVTATLGTRAYLAESGQEGIFRWVTSNESSDAFADYRQAVTLLSATDSAKFISNAIVAADVTKYNLFTDYDGMLVMRQIGTEGIWSYAGVVINPLHATRVEIDPVEHNATVGFAIDPSTGAGVRRGVLVSGSQIYAQTDGVTTLLGTALDRTQRLFLDRTAAGIITIRQGKSFADSTLVHTFAGTYALASVLTFGSFNLASTIRVRVATGTTLPGASGVWKRDHVAGIIHASWFGAKGDGVTNDTNPICAIGDWVTRLGHGRIIFAPNATYMVGSQLLYNPPIFQDVTFHAAPLMTFKRCTGSITIEGNGAKLKGIAGLKYGSFNNAGAPRGNTAPYTGEGSASPFGNIIDFDHCAGSIIVENLELDGNINNMTIGSPWGDTGIQLDNNGLVLDTCTGAITLRHVNAHHFGRDGVHYNGRALNDGAYREQFTATNCNFDSNVRLGVAWVGGRGGKFINSTFNWNAAYLSPSGGLVLSSNPASGVDFEAEGGRFNRDVQFEGCDFIGNYSTAFVSDSGTPTDRISFTDCRFVQTNVSGYTVWANRPGFKYTRCLFAGTVAIQWSGNVSGTENPYDAVQYDDCIFTNSNDYAPAGFSVQTINDLIIEGGVQFVVARNSVFIHDRATTKVNGNTDGMRFEGCTFIVKQGTYTHVGRYSGRTHFVKQGAGAFGNSPNVTAAGAGQIPATGKAGIAEDPFYYTVAGVTTRYQATVDPITGASL